MTSRAWLIAALGLLAAVSNAAAQDSYRSSPFGSEEPATRRLSDYFTRGARSRSKPVDPATAEARGRSGLPADPRAAMPAGAAPAPRNPLAQQAEPAFDDAEPSSFDKTDDAAIDRTFQRLRNKSRATAVKPADTAGDKPVRTAAKEDDFLSEEIAEEEDPFASTARTPSGAPLSRRTTPAEDASKIIHATHEFDGFESSDKIEKVGAKRPAADDLENPFVPVEEFLKKGAKPNSPAAKGKSTPAEARANVVVTPEAKSRTADDKGPEASEAKTGTRTGNVTVTAGTPGTKKPAAKTPAKPAAKAGQVTRVGHTEDVPFGGEPAMETFNVDALEDGSLAPQVSVRWVKRSEINVGQPCECDLVVKNSGSVAAQDVTVEAYFPRTVRLTSAKPEPAEVTDRLSWKFPVLGAGEEQSIHITMIPSRKGELETTANVRCTGSASGVFEVEEPMLALDLKGAKEVLVGDPASQIITVSNPGTGIVKNVTIEALIPKGLEHPRGERLQMEVGSLGPGESRTIRLALAAVTGGACQVQVTAKADANLAQSATADVLVVAPSVKLTIDGPSLRYIGRSAVYQLSTLNDGAAPSNNVRVVHKVPEGFKFLRADRGGKFDESNQTITWFVGRIEPRQTVDVKCELTPTQVGKFTHLVGAISEQGARSETSFDTEVDGTSALQIEIVEQADPVEVGSEMMYEIRLKNSGSEAAENVAISCELASAVQLLTAKAPTEAIVENGLVVFKSLPSMPPGKTAVYRVAVKASAEGAHRFRVRLASESITEPLISEELTKFYGE